MQHPRATPRAGPGRNSVITPDEGQSASDAASSVTNGSFKESASNKIVFKICDPDPSYETYETFRAVLFYLYTGFIAFTSLGSAHAETGAGSEATVDMDDDRVAMYWNFAEYKNALRYSKFCGDPRSIYELADLWEIPGLKRAAASHIERNLTPANIVTGLFSDFTGRHPELQGFHIERAIEYWDDIATTPAMKEVLQSPNPQTVEIMLRLFAGLRKEKR
ncbi:hypothetical protein PUNSTDRAFT_144404 [Punctularia strigosozonata HHB-11173 SS5]|uniref:uncharacterized protein n=1 Tax=Punctularia strigosozonata (strain HHB-11173) TaxID=741275 RepID=UPI000441831C|nr:uncharacterized protein PUNSTDRAFT_144404 [Punctularia strigosozonata HHB-11173 SS5]EIN07916.1 hypothetical protein PUNSTDRAFT_144404 [Punctularia strigosozonata HHB-11173 SS5]